MSQHQVGRAVSSIPQSAIYSTPIFMQVVHVLRLLLEENIHNPRDLQGLSAKENRKAGRRSCIRSKTKSTLAEWEHLVHHVAQLSPGYHRQTPSFQEVHAPRFNERDMRMEVVDFMMLMKSLGRCDPQRFLHYLAVSREIRRTGRLRRTLSLHLVGDCVCD